jgi:hypothetical protein
LASPDIKHPCSPVSEQEEIRLTARLLTLTDDGGNALVSRYGLLVVAFSPLEGLGKVHGRLVRLALEIQLVDAALRDH